MSEKLKVESEKTDGIEGVVLEDPGADGFSIEHEHQKLVGAEHRAEQAERWLAAHHRLLREIERDLSRIDGRYSHFQRDTLLSFILRKIEDGITVNFDDYTAPPSDVDDIPF